VVDQDHLCPGAQRIVRLGARRIRDGALEHEHLARQRAVAVRTLRGLLATCALRLDGGGVTGVFGGLLNVQLLRGNR